MPQDELHRNAPFVTTIKLAPEDDLEPGPPTILTSIETALHIGIPVTTLEGMRRDNRGPRYFRLTSGHARKVVYMLHDVQAWLKKTQSKET